MALNNFVSEENKEFDPESEDITREDLVNEYGLGWDGSVFGAFLNHRFDNNRDVKIIITSRSSSTGLGKTTLAVQICRYIDRNGWTSRKSFIDVGEYIDSYLNTQQYSALLLDEIEHGADSRRAMSSDNVDLSKAWATLRFRNIATVSTLPTTSMLDNRLLELADIWINVVTKGLALPYFIFVNDFTGEIGRVPLRHPETGERELLFFDDLGDDKSFKKLSSKKNKNTLFGDSRTYDKSDINKSKKKAKKQQRNELIVDLYKNTDLSQSDIARLKSIDVNTQQSVSQIIQRNSS